ncbi:MAG: efflux RND transporter periplasmic adaptor subunit [Ignavibacteriaceae bacterium]
MEKSNKKILIISKKTVLFSLILIISILFISCGGNESNNTNDVNSGTPVTVIHPFKTNLSDYIELNGNAVFLTKEIVRATFDGFINNVYKNIGDSVKAREDLFQIKTKESAAADSLNISFGNKQFKGTVTLKAQSDGVLTELNFHQGDFVSNGEQLAIISNPSSLRIKLNVPFEDISKVKIGRDCEVNLPDGNTIPGTIEKNVPAVNPVTQTQIYFIKLKKSHHIPDSLNVIVKIPYKSFKNATALPKSSIVTNVTQDNFWIMKLINDTTAIRENIKKGIENDSLVQVLSPKLDTADRVILTGAYGLPDTAKVEIVK